MERAKALDRMMASCSRREYCKREIMAKLSHLEVERSEAESIVEALCREKYIDEPRYAVAFARDKSSLQGWGPMKIRMALSAKGIDDGTISAALDEVDHSSAEKKLRTLIAGKMRQLRSEDERTRRLKVLRYALGRGYDYDPVLQIYDELLRSER